MTHYLGYSALNDFFPTMTLRPNVQCENKHCRDRQQDYQVWDNGNGPLCIVRSGIMGTVHCVLSGMRMGTLYYWVWGMGMGTLLWDCISILCIQEHIPLIPFTPGKYIYMWHVLSQLVGGGAEGPFQLVV